MGAGAAGSLTGAAELFRFWVFPDCTFLDISNDTTIISSDITPTLSPKDPAFPAWWETHKSEGEA